MIINKAKETMAFLYPLYRHKGMCPNTKMRTQPKAMPKKYRNESLVQEGPLVAGSMGAKMKKIYATVLKQRNTINERKKRCQVDERHSHNYDMEIWKQNTRESR
jgi:hypothetical protein